MLDAGCSHLTPELEDLLGRYPERFAIEYVPNSGPYRKIIPLLDELYAGDPAALWKNLIVTADDDTLYPTTWLRGLYAAFCAHACVVGYRGRTMVVEKGKLAPYDTWERKIVRNPSGQNLLTGKDGILYSPLHLHPAVLDIRTALAVAPKADDIWLKAHALLARVPSAAINRDLKQELPSIPGADDGVSLFRAFNRGGGNDEALAEIGRYLRSAFGTSWEELFADNSLPFERVVARGLSVARSEFV